MAKLNSKVIYKEYRYYFFLFLRNEDTEINAYLVSHSYSDSRIADLWHYFNHLLLLNS